MFDILLTWLGKRTCPYCHQRKSPVRDWLADHLPYRLYAGLKIGKWDYNYWVGTVNRRLHARHS